MVFGRWRPALKISTADAEKKKSAVTVASK